MTAPYVSNRGLTGRATCSAEDCEKVVHGRGLCPMHYERARKLGTLPIGGTRPSPCGVDGCTQDRCEGRTICGMHRGRLRHHGAVGSPGRLRAKPGGIYPGAEGYLIRTLPDHPLARAQGKVLEHRRVLYDEIGPGPHPCHWCSRQVDWTHGVGDRGALVIDHLDFNRSNNDPANLVPTCHTCNSARKP